MTKRYGNLKNGVNDIKNHRWFSGLDWNKVISKEIAAPFVPKVSSPSDTSNFSKYPDSDTLAPAIRSVDDPFSDW